MIEVKCIIGTWDLIRSFIFYITNRYEAQGTREMYLTVGANRIMFSSKKTGFSPVKNTSHFFYFVFTCMQHFSADTTVFSKKKKIIYFLPMKNLKNKSQKLLTIGLNVFHSPGPAAQTSLELIFRIINMSQDSSVSLSVMYHS